MKRFFILFLLSICLIACNSTTENTMVVSGNVKGLKKGTIYLQKIQDTVLTSVDSIQISGDGNFSLTTELESPEIYYLYLDKVDNNKYNDRITFFAEAGNITINTTWNTFATKAEISGSETQKKFEEVNKNLSKYNKKSLELSHKTLSPNIRDNAKAVDSINKLIDKNSLSSFRYALNYAIGNKNSYIAPYIAITEVPNANVKYLDSIYNSLPNNIASSKYGKKLKEHIADIKAKK